MNPGNNSNSGLVNVQGSTLSGTVFRDFANTGTMDVGDTGIAGISMSLSGTAFDASPVAGTSTTNGSGVFTFDPGFLAGHDKPFDSVADKGLQSALSKNGNQVSIARLSTLIV